MKDCVIFTNALRKQLYRQEVPERRSKIYTNKQISGGGNFLPAVCLEETLKYTPMSQHKERGNLVAHSGRKPFGGRGPRYGAQRSKDPLAGLGRRLAAPSPNPHPV